jgi:translocation and assembly module TamA
MKIALIGFASVLLVQSAAMAQEKTPEQTNSLLPTVQVGFKDSVEAKAFAPLCDSILIENKNDIKLSDMEKRLLCGDDAKDPIGRAWNRIPPNEAAYFLKGFLQARGYHQPIFIQDGSTLFLRLGPLSRLQSFHILDAPKGWDPPRRRLIQGRAMTPPLLDELQSWTLSQIKNDGYACATAEAQGDPQTQDATVKLTPGESKIIAHLEDTGDAGLRSGALNRYNAFRIGDVYNESLVKLTKTRTEQDGFLQSLMISTRCEPLQVTLVRDVVLGPARVIRVGVGGSTAEGGKVRAIVRQNRIGASASSAQLQTNLSYLQEMVNYQDVTAKFRWWYSPGEERSYLEPNIKFDHDAKDKYETQSVQANMMHGWSQEFTRGSVDTQVGPGWLQSNVSRGPLPSQSSIFLGRVSSRWLNHDFEVFPTSPRSGEFIEGSGLFTFKNWGSPFTAQKVQLTGQKLWNIYRFDPPLLIVGVRFSLSSVFSPDPNISADLPVEFLTLLGGERDLRGFDAQSLPRSGVGALSGATGSVEVRFHRILFKQADVFGFFDSGALGGAQFKLEHPVFMSPGLGLRWESPIGVLRTYIAQRFAVAQDEIDLPYPKQWRWGFTYGEEF